MQLFFWLNLLSHIWPNEPMWDHEVSWVLEYKNGTLDIWHMRWELFWEGFKRKKVLLDIRLLRFRSWREEIEIYEKKFNKSFEKPFRKSFGKSYISFGFWAGWEWKQSFDQVLKVVVGGGWCTEILTSALLLLFLNWYFEFWNKRFEQRGAGAELDNLTSK